MLDNRESEQMTFSTKLDPFLQSNVAACARGIKTTNVVTNTKAKPSRGKLGLILCDALIAQL
jgi:hypothetical protein